MLILEQGRHRGIPLYSLSPAGSRAAARESKVKGLPGMRELLFALQGATTAPATGWVWRAVGQAGDGAAGGTLGLWYPGQEDAGGGM